MSAHHGAFVALGVAGVAAVAALALASVPGEDGQSTRLPQPPSWVAFSADVVHTVSGQPGRVLGRFFRGPDGSTCAVMGDPGAPTSILTNDVGRRLVYRFRNDKRSWLRQPMGLPASMPYKPPQFSAAMPGLAERPEPFEGMRAYELTTGGSARTLVPDLNFFVVRTSGEGWSRQFANIVVGAVMPEHCWPPPGAEITDSDQPAGITIR